MTEDQARLIEMIHDTGIVGEIARITDEEIDDDEVEKVREKWDAILDEVGFDWD